MDTECRTAWGVRFPSWRFARRMDGSFATMNKNNDHSNNTTSNNDNHFAACFSSTRFLTTKSNIYIDYRENNRAVILIVFLQKQQNKYNRASKQAN